FHTLCCSINKIDDKTTEPQKDKIINRAITDSKSLIKGTIEILEYQAEASAINWIKKTEGMKNLMKNYAKFTYRGKQLYGKQFLKVEVLALKKIEQWYIKGQKEGLKHSYRSIAFFVAQTELGIDKEADQILFYKRFLRYHKKKK
ncbi:MAG: hypothetical protein KJO59_11405, partial [Ignavibacteria bacterium]|nr:hypothetical protein [Ignavibacteria bacterium]